MAEHEEHKVDKEEQEESMMDKISDKLHFTNHQSSSPAPASASSSSDSDDEKKKATSPPLTTSSFGSKVRRLFGRERPVHKVFGGGKREFRFFKFSSLLNKKIKLERI